MTKWVCAGTRAIVRTLPSGRISEEARRDVICRPTWRPGKKDILPRRAGEDLPVCRELLRFIRAKMRQVNGSPSPGAGAFFLSFFLSVCFASLQHLRAQRTRVKLAGWLRFCQFSPRPI